LACVLALDGRRDEAFANLQYALDHSLRDETRQGMEKDTDLNALHGDTRFAALVAKANQVVAAKSQ